MVKIIDIPCKHVWREVSNYIENDVTPELRQQLEQHFRGCHHCQAILDGAKNLLTLVGDDRSFELPAGFGNRLFAKLEESLR